MREIRLLYERYKLSRPCVNLMILVISGAFLVSAFSCISPPRWYRPSPEITNAQLLKQVEPGVTTQSDVLSWFGNPSLAFWAKDSLHLNTMLDDSIQIWTYLYNTKKTVNSLDVWFDGNGIVTGGRSSEMQHTDIFYPVSQIIDLDPFDDDSQKGVVEFSSCSEGKYLIKRHLTIKIIGEERRRQTLIGVGPRCHKVRLVTRPGFYWLKYDSVFTDSLLEIYIPKDSIRIDIVKKMVTPVSVVLTALESKKGGIISGRGSFYLEIHDAIPLDGSDMMQMKSADHQDAVEKSSLEPLSSQKDSTVIFLFIAEEEVVQEVAKWQNNIACFTSTANPVHRASDLSEKDIAVSGFSLFNNGIGLLRALGFEGNSCRLTTTGIDCPNIFGNQDSPKLYITYYSFNEEGATRVMFVRGIEE